jgi:hypothetical protein
MVFKRRERPRGGQVHGRGDRRRAVRRALGWPSRYVLTDDSALFAYHSFDHSPCVVHDLSIAGAGLKLSGRDVCVGDRVVLDLQLGERERASIQVTGEVRHARTDDDGHVWTGIEFVDIGDLERALLLRLLHDQRDQARRAG